MKVKVKFIGGVFMKLTDIIAREILDMLESEDGIALIQRNELATQIGCVPSQINYVITSRFTPEQGYIVESRRGGGGYIRIRRIHHNGNEAMMHIINSIGDTLDEATVRAILDNLVYDNLVSPKMATLILAATSDSTLRPLNYENKHIIRARIFKRMLLNV